MVVRWMVLARMVETNASTQLQLLAIGWVALFCGRELICGGLAAGFGLYDE